MPSWHRPSYMKKLIVSGTCPFPRLACRGCLRRLVVELNLKMSFILW